MKWSGYNCRQYSSDNSRLDIELMKDIAYLTLMGKVWDIPHKCGKNL